LPSLETSKTHLPVAQVIESPPAAAPATAETLLTGAG